MKSNIKLKQGEYTYQEIADWLGISAHVFKSHINEYYEELKQYAIFSVVGAKILIKKVLFPFRLENLGCRKSFKKLMFNCFDKIGNEKQIANRMKRLYGDSLKDYSLPRIIYYIRYFIQEYYGTPYEEGLAGKLEKTYFRIEKDRVCELTEEQQKTKERLIQQWFGNITEQVLLLKDKLDNGEIDKEECWDYIEDNLGLKYYKDFKKDFEKSISADVVNGFRTINRQEYDIEIDDEDIEDDSYSIDIY